MYTCIGKAQPGLLERSWGEYNVVWNPQGWGSCSIPLDDVRVPGVRIATLLGIKPGGVIPLHIDNPAQEHSIDAHLVRQHIVLETNDKCWNYHDGSWQQLEIGSLYMMDPKKEHASVNWGTTTRWHLILDVEE